MSTLTVKSIYDATHVVTSTLAKLGNPKIAFIGQRAADVKMFTPFIPIDLVISLDFEEVEIPTISLEKKIGRKDLWYSTALSELLRDHKIAGSIKAVLPPGSMIIPYASFNELEKFCDTNGYVLLGERYCKRCAFENKAKLVGLKEDLNLQSTSRILQSANLDYSQLCNEYGQKFVVQNPNGSSGTGTFIIECHQDLEQSLQSLDHEVIVSQFHEGLTISANFVITDNQILSVCPSIQVVGQPELSVSSSTFSGVDFPLFQKAVSVHEAQHIQGLVNDVAIAMYKYGYRGPANVNIMHKGRELTDINARFMGSGLLTTQSQLKQGIVPISLVHIMQFLNIDFRLEDTVVQSYTNPINASMIVKHNLVETENVALNAPISRIFFEGSVLDLSGRLIPKYQHIAKE